jgi:hypothetical protein
VISTDNKLVFVIEQYGLQNGADCLKASRAVGLDLSYCCALLEMESGGRNIFGGDPWNPREYPKGAALPVSWSETPVTRAKYTYYKLRRNRGMQPNGVGPCQLTSAGVQMLAEDKGGCWKPLHNMEIGFGLLKRLITINGKFMGYQEYNGSGPAAEAYARNATGLQIQWHNLFVSHGLA